MPATYSKQRATDHDADSGRVSGTGAGGPLTRTGSMAEEWDSYVGQSLSNMPGGQLPLVVTILQRYRALRIDSPNSPTSTLAKLISSEVLPIWNKARLPILSPYRCKRKIVDAIEMWNAVHKGGGPGGSHAHQKLQPKLDSLLNIAKCQQGKKSCEKFLEDYKAMIKKSGIPSWEDDYNFFVDQYQVMMHDIHLPLNSHFVL